MSITVEATYEDGMLKPDRPLPLNEQERVQVIVRRGACRADQTYGIIAWHGDGNAFDRLFKESDVGVSSCCESP